VIFFAAQFLKIIMLVLLKEKKILLGLLII